MLRSKSKRLSKLLSTIKSISYGTAISALAVFTILFGTSILENFHLSYLRYLMKDTVLVHNFEGAGGTGWVTTLKSGKTIVITNGHVCGLKTSDGTLFINYRGEEYQLKVIKEYAKHDLCAIEAPEGATGGYKVASSTTNGESVFTLGHPYLEPNTITKGELSGPHRTQFIIGFNMPCDGETYQKYSAEQVNPFLALLGVESVCTRVLTGQASPVIILPGNSGSCTVNIYGNVVGVAYAGNEFGTRSYHVPLKDLQDFLSTL